MNPASIEILLALLVLLILFMGVRAVLARERITSRLTAFPLTHNLALLSMLGVIPFAVAVEMGGRYGMGVVLAMFAFGVIYLLVPVILAPIQILARTRRFAGIADILVYRFRSIWFGKLASVGAALTLLPFAMAQIIAIAFIFDEYAGIQDRLTTTLFAAAAVGGASLWISWHEGKSTKTQGVFLATLSFLSLFALIALAVTTVALVYEVFNGVQGLSRWAESTGQNQVVQRYEKGYALITLFFLASMVLPQLFSLRAKSSTYQDMRYSSWLFPLLLFLASVPVFPLVWSGLAVEGEIPLQLYGAVLPGLLDLPVISVIAIAGALAAAAGGFTCLSVALSESIVNTIFQPHQQDFTQKNLYRWLRSRKRIAAAGVLVVSVGAALLLRSQSLTDMVLVSFVGVVQLSPALLATFYFSRINRKGVTAGLAVGLTAWTATLFLPLFIGNWDMVIPGLGAISVGVEGWHHMLYEILFLNFATCLIVSLFTKTDQEEKRYADECLVDSVPLPQRVDIQECSLTEVERRLSSVLGAEVAREEIAKIVRELQLNPSETRPQAIRVVRDRLMANLCSQIGVYAGQSIVERTIPLLSGGKEPDDLLIFERLLPNSSGQLSGLSAELNRLRLHHRTTLENLPVGVCSLDTDGEVLFWNNAMESITGVSGDKTNGALLRQLPEPWATLLSDFSASDDTRRSTLKVPRQDREQWCNLYKTVIDIEPSQLLGSQVLLAEDITEPLLLNRELIHTERLASVGRLAAGVAHEIGNPVTGIACLAQDIGRDAKDSEVRKSASMILEQTGRITDIVRSLTSFSRRSDQADAKFTSLPIKAPVKSAINLLTLQQRNGITFASDIDDHIMVEGDLHQLTQVFLNLLTNASDASPEQGVVSVAVEQQDESVIARVIDQGDGIPEAIRDKVFEPFFTTKDTGEGTGLGLSLVYDIIRNHNGEIRVVSLDGGNCMEVKLPLVLATGSQQGKTSRLEN